MSTLTIMVCPWQKVTECTQHKDETGLNINTLKQERFGTCYRESCPLFNCFSKTCTATKVLSIIQR